MIDKILLNLIAPFSNNLHHYIKIMRLKACLNNAIFLNVLIITMYCITSKSTHYVHGILYKILI